MRPNRGVAAIVIPPAFYENVWLVTLWLSTVLAAEILAGGAIAQCPYTKCGVVEIPYPFGIGPGSCTMTGFELQCNNSKPYLGDFEVLNISLQLGQLRVMNRISSFCYNATSEEMKPDRWQTQLDTPFRLSDTANKFTVIGCRTLAYIADEDNIGKYMSGCVSVCRRGEVTSATNGTCSGIGCCQTAIPTDLRYYQAFFDEGLNTSASIYNATPCSYAVLLESSNFTFSTSYLTSKEFNNSYGGQAPMVIDWAIRSATSCEEARNKPESYACKSSNSECFNARNGPGYICNCTKGYQGNPYLQGPDGCQDINECEKAENYSCYGKCLNKLGGFDCICHVGSRGNASIPGGCQKDYFSPKARLAIGAAACVLVGLFGFLIWEVIRHKRNIKRQALLRQSDEYFQQHGGQLLREMMKVEGNIAFTLYNREQIEAATNNFDKAHIVGEGGQGTVFKAVLDGTDVAIKKCKEIDETRKMDFLQELVILCRVNHPNIVKLLGCCLQFEAPILVYEFVKNKTLQELLDHQRRRNCCVTLGTRLRIAAESANALAHLHSLPHPILHGDVKPANILLAEGWIAKVSDFGCSTIDEKTQAVPKGTVGYLDPDYMVEYQLTAKNDVYSFGVILLELLTVKKPLSKERKSLTSMFQEAMADGTLVKLLDSYIVDEASMRVIYQAALLASQCLAIPGTTRPAMRQVAEELQKLALADEVQKCQQPPLVLDGLCFMEMGNTTSSWYRDSKTSGAYSLEKKAVLNTQLAR